MRSLRQNQTPAENMLWQELRRKQIFGYKFRRQHAVGQFIIDFYCSPLKLGIEVDGNHFVITKIQHTILQLPPPPRAEEGWGGGMKRRKI